MAEYGECESRHIFYLHTYLFVLRHIQWWQEIAALWMCYICPCVRLRYIPSYIFNFYFYFYYFQLTTKPLSLCIPYRWRRYMCSWRRQKKIENSLFLVRTLHGGGFLFVSNAVEMLLIIFFFSNKPFHFLFLLLLVCV